MSIRINIDREQLHSFCRRWKVKELSLFGSVLSDRFNPDSDVDVLVAFDEAADWSLLELMDMIEELKAMFGRKVDLVEKEAIRNPFRRHHILKNREVVYEAG